MTAADPLAAVAESLEQQAEAQATDAGEFGRLVERFPGGRTYLRTGQDGRPISSLVLNPAPNGQRIVYELIGIDSRDLT
jgi:hypothetical protein